MPTFGEFLRDQVEERLKYFETGEAPKKNLEVMAEAKESAKVVQEKVRTNRKQNQDLWMIDIFCKEKVEM